jgi:biofilm protein TabA
MIHDTIENAGRYAPLHPLFPRAFEELRRLDISHLPAGRKEIDGDAMYMMIIRSDGSERARPVLEAHRRYIDIQFTVAGSDVIGWRALRECAGPTAPYSREKDVALYDDTPEVWSVLHPGMFAVYFPEDAHAPLAGDGPVEKVVLKVLLSET